MINCGEQYATLTKEIELAITECGRAPAEITLVAVSKTRTIEEILEVYNAGCRDFGENKVQDLVKKRDALPGDVRWHMIGHLQKNKAKFIAGNVHLIHSVDSFELAQEIHKRATSLCNVLLEFNVSAEESKSGFNDKSELLETAKRIQKELGNVSMKGLMTIASPCERPEEVRNEFKKMRSLRSRLAEALEKKESELELSMGMSSDWRVALEEGATIIRLGTAIFGSRDSGFGIRDSGFGDPPSPEPRIPNPDPRIPNNHATHTSRYKTSTISLLSSRL